MTMHRSPHPRIGLALAGGGPLGAIYEVGALCALEESIEGLDFTACDGYLGVSAGGIISACLANGITPRELCAGFIENSSAPPDHFDPAILLYPNWREYLARLLKKYDGNRRKVADALGVSERTAYRMMDRHGYK